MTTSQADSPPTSDVANGRLRLFLTSDCNLACFYCHNEGQPKGSSYLSRSLARRVRDLLQEGGVRKLILSGGEPLIHPNVVEFVETLSPFVERTSLITNGLLLDRVAARRLKSAGLVKVRLGVDSFRADKPRPSKGYLSEDFSIARTVANAREAGLQLDLNVVLTKFNSAEIPRFLEFAAGNGLHIKFFEHLKVRPPLAGALTNRMAPMPQVAEESFMATLRATLGRLPDFTATDAFAPATIAARVGSIEIRYCRYLCTYGRCWAPGTRVDPEGYVYTCMSSRGLDRISPRMTLPELRTAVRRASQRACGASIN